MFRCARAAALTILAVLIAVACQASRQERVDTSRGQQLRADTSRPKRRIPISIDARLAAIADEVPGFAGTFVRGDTVVVMLVDTARLDEAVRVVRRSQRASLERYRHFVAHPARYNFRQLYGWRQRATDVMGAQGVVTLGVDEARNAAHLGVRDSSFVEPVRAALIARGLPANAIAMEVTGPVRFQGGPP